MIRNLVENYKIISGTTPVTTNGGVTGDYVSLKNANKAWIICKLTQAVGHATVLSPKQATAVAGTGVKAFVNTLKINANEDISASDTLAAQTAAVTYTVTNDVKNKLIIFEIDPADLDTANDFDCIGFTASDSSQADNLIGITYILDMKYKEDVPPAAITD